jgi:hypothetical protein
LTSLVKKLDAEGAHGLKSFVIYLSDDEKLPDQLKEYAVKNSLKNIILAVDNVPGPPAWTIAKEADVTVVLYNKRNVEANHAFADGKLDAKGVAKVLADLPKILAK